MLEQEDLAFELEPQLTENLGLGFGQKEIVEADEGITQVKEIELTPGAGKSSKALWRSEPRDADVAERLKRVDDPVRLQPRYPWR